MKLSRRATDALSEIEPTPAAQFAAKWETKVMSEPAASKPPFLKQRSSERLCNLAAVKAAEAEAEEAASLALPPQAQRQPSRDKTGRPLPGKNKKRMRDLGKDSDPSDPTRRRATLPMESYHVGFKMPPPEDNNLTFNDVGPGRGSATKDRWDSMKAMSKANKE